MSCDHRMCNDPTGLLCDNPADHDPSGKGDHTYTASNGCVPDGHDASEDAAEGRRG